MTTVCELCAVIPGNSAQSAAFWDHLECLKAAYATGCPSWHYRTAEAACVRGHERCLGWALSMGAKAGYFTARAAHHYRRWGCLEYAVRNGCPVDPLDDNVRPVFVRLWTEDILAAVVREASRAAARTIQEGFREAYYDPRFALCRRRLHRQFLELPELGLSSA